jgi:pimeloyl-ACP methyl ester carboxylesterase
VVLRGHAWGTLLGTIYAHQHPQHVAASGGSAQMADMAEGARLSYAFARSAAAQRGHRRALAALHALGPSLDAVAERLT